MKRTKKEQEVEKEAGLTGVVDLPLELEERKKAANEMPDDYTLEVIADNDPSADVFRIPNPDPRYEYRFLRDNQEVLSIKTGALLHQQGGWQLVEKAHLIRIGINERFISPDGFYRVGQNILSFMPKHLYDKKVAGKTARAEARMGEITRLIKKGDPSVGGKEIHKTMKGIQTKEQLRM